MRLISDSQDPRYYSPGETVKIAFELWDESGVQQVIALFVPEGGTGNSILLRGDGEGAKKTTVVLEGQVEESSQPGKYRLQYLQAHDTKDNYNMLRPDPSPEFYVEPHSGDSEGPQGSRWTFVD